MTLGSGTALGPYTITADLGHGGMGVVYTATDPRLDRQVAIKALPPDLTRDDTAKQRFLQEAKAASALDHPNICTIYEINETGDGQLYLVMAYYEGGDAEGRGSSAGLWRPVGTTRPQNTVERPSRCQEDIPGHWSSSPCRLLLLGNRILRSASMKSWWLDRSRSTVRRCILRRCA